MTTPELARWIEATEAREAKIRECHADGRPFWTANCYEGEAAVVAALAYLDEERSKRLF